MNEPLIPTGATLRDILAEDHEPWKVTAAEFLPTLLGGLWHTTSLERYRGILRSGAILAEPPIAESERWKTAAGPKHYPLVRFLGGVSLFDFAEFDPEAYDAAYVFSSWRTFVPFRWEWGAAVWLEIDRRKIVEAFIDTKTLVEHFNRDGLQGHDFMPMIEAAHIGALPTSAISRVIFVDGKSGKVDFGRIGGVSDASAERPR